MKRISSALVFSAASVLAVVSAPHLSAFGNGAVALKSQKSCPADADAIGAMVDELKGTFECSGLNLKECNEYRSGVIGGGIAASVAAGIGAFKARPDLVACMMPGRSVSLLREQSQGKPVLAMLALGFFGPLAESASSCRFPTKELAKEFRDMSDEHYREAKALKHEMLDRLMAQNAPDALKKVDVPDTELRKHFVEGLEQLEKQVRGDSSGKLAVHKQWMIDDITRLKTQYRSAGSYAEMMLDFDKLSANYNLKGKAELIEPETLKKLRVWDLKESLRAEKVASLSDPSLKAVYQKALSELDTFSDMTQMSGKASYLKSLGYPPDLVEKVLSAEGKRRELQFRGARLQMAAHDLNYGQMKSTKFLEQKELAKFMREKHLQFFDHPITRWGNMPGINSGFVRSVAQAGRAAMAKVTSAAAGDLAGLTKFGLKGAALVGSKAFAAVSETAFFMKDVHCGGENPSKFVTVAYDPEKEKCAASNERSELTDAFLFGLSREEQLKEIQNGNGACEMLMGLHARYAPSQNWNLRCEGTEATLSGAGEDGAGQMLKFETKSGLPRDIQWFSSDFESCAKVSLKEDGQIDHALIYGYENKGTCGTGSAVRMTESLAWSRGAVTDQRKLMRQFSAWQRNNSFAIASAVGCCRGEANALCSDGLNANGSSKVRTNRSVRTQK